MTILAIKFSKLTPNAFWRNQPQSNGDRDMAFYGNNGIKMSVTSFLPMIHSVRLGTSTAVYVILVAPKQINPCINIANTITIDQLIKELLNI